MTRYNTIVILLFLIPLQVFSNLSLDSLQQIIKNSTGEKKMEAMLELASYKANINTREGLNEYRKILEASIKNNYKFGVSKSLANIGYALTLLEKFKDARDTLRIARDKFIEMKDISRAAYCVNQIARSFELEGRYQSGVDKYMEALNMLDSQQIGANDSTKVFLNMLGIIYTDLGMMHFKLDNLKSARNYFYRALWIGNKANDSRRIAGSYSNLGMIHRQYGETQNALDYYFKAVKYAKEINHVRYLGSIYQNISNIYTDLRNFSGALHYLEKANRNWIVLGEEINVVDGYISEADLNLAMGDLSKCRALLDSVSEYFSDQKKNSLSYKDFLVLNSKYYELSGEYKKALDYYIKSISVRDNLISTEKAIHLEKVMAKYEAEKKENENALLRLETERDKKIIVYFILGSSLLIALLVFMIIQYRLKNKALSEIKMLNQKLSISNIELEESRKKLKELNDSKDKFFSIIGHDLKNPLSIYKSMSDFILKSLDNLSRNDIAEFMQELQKSAKKTYSLLENLLTWARMQSGKIEFNPEMNNIYAIIESNLQLLKLSAEKKNIEIARKIDDKVEAVFDANMINTVVRNLVSNAIKFTPEKGRVEVALQENNGFYNIIVSDTGLGISPEDKRKLFRLDTQHTTPGTANEQGTGLGLILCKDFIDMHGGRIDIESEEGNGSKFIISIPKEINIEKV